MTVYVKIGRRVPKSWFRRGAEKIKGLMTFQENIWQIINQSMRTARRKCNQDGRMKFEIQKEMESEDMNYQIEWLKITIAGPPDMEEEEYNETLKMYTSLQKAFKKDFQTDERLAKHFKTNILSTTQVQDAYQMGYGAMGEGTMANKLLEMGILTHVEWEKDFDYRSEQYL